MIARYQNTDLTMCRRTYLLLALTVAACATPEPPPLSIPSPEPVAPRAEAKPARTTPALPAPKAKRPGPIPTRALNVAAECRFRDETGYNGNMKLTIEQAKVQTFEAAVNIPRRGVCRFDLKNFRQTQALPTVELSHRRDACVVRVWEQGERVTVAFHECRKMCSGSAWEHLWPILNDTRDGSCA